MFKRIMVLGIVVLIFAFAAQPARAEDPPGAKLFATYCAACHGAAGIGGGAPAIGTAAYLNAHDDASITQITTDGRMEKGMPMWGKSKGGTLTDAQIADIVTFLRLIVDPSVLASAPAPASTVASSPVVYSQTAMTMKESQNVDGSIFVATLLKPDGTPVVGVPIVFARPTVMGDLTLGTVKTNKNGNASITVIDQSDQNRYVTATFGGDPGFGSSEAMLRLDRPVVATTTGSVNINNINLSLKEPLLAPEGSLITPNPPLVPTTLFLLIVGFIWSIYGFVIYQVVGIWKDGRPAKSLDNDRPAKAQENTLSMKRKPIQ